MLKALIGADIFDGNRFLKNHALILCNETIDAVLPRVQLPKDMQCITLAGGTLAPGFIDLQVNGGGGKLFNNAPSLDALQAMLNGHRQFGTTSMMPTLISDGPELRDKGSSAVQHAINTFHKGILGIHLEGPFFNKARRGIHKTEYLRCINNRDIHDLVAQHHAFPEMITIVTLAPEQTQPGQIKCLVDAGIIVCAGHTDADHYQVERALDEGLKGFTHLYNAMRPLKSRDPGVVGIALADVNSWCGLIADGHHVHPIAIKVAIAAKPVGKIFLVSDAMATVGSDNKNFTLYGETIRESDGCLINAEGRLAGSAIGMMDAVRYCVEQVGVALDEALRMASLYPAQLIEKDDQLGLIQRGYRADLVHFDGDLKVIQTWVAGAHQLS